MKQYDKQFKEQAVKLVLDLVRPVKSANQMNSQGECSCFIH